MDIGLAIYKIRKQKGLKLDSVATAAETDTGYLSRIEKGSRQPSIPMLGKIASALGCRVSEIFAVAEEGPMLPASELDLSEEAINVAELRKALRDLSKSEYSLVVDFARMLAKRR
ncbi:transcriptional regulator with XRE-family HTH domain [Silvimonas terrae]|uniref:Transcriptional regulator with XRE-family HTH domain n=1 Tax=Silvimonas terrae TaxID=300266 RepID=A0A840RB66_9NEIS|nr:helix-turn-helix transcriptional regulator [Silvimonas terrae]MBB5189590.1 transcriptional regulator with XRE-family HTH domain [Silvimonas terrae]